MSKIRLYKAVKSLEKNVFTSVYAKDQYAVNYPINSTVEASKENLKKGFGLLVCKDFYEATQQGGTHILLCYGLAEDEMELPTYRLDVEIFEKPRVFQKRLFSLLKGNEKNSQFKCHQKRYEIVRWWPKGTAMFKKIYIDRLLIRRSNLYSY